MLWQLLIVYHAEVWVQVPVPLPMHVQLSSLYHCRWQRFFAQSGGRSMSSSWNY